MALVPCPECQNEVSTHALACPRCAFPFPGKHGVLDSSPSQKLHPCPDCGFLVSKHARTCPHCGVTKPDEQTPQATNGNLIEETWLCPHCGTSYTRKVQNKEEKVIVGDQVLPPNTEEMTMEESPRVVPNPAEGDVVPGPQRKQSPLWHDSSFSAKRDYEAVSRRYSRGKTKSRIVGLIIFLLVVGTIVLGALWQYQGIHPLEILTNL